ncbi:hypothetical protein VP1G_00588 [Cytospora mali]|uniref:UBC core domain-containing protein n=1 Tax=Cytospora mali TaxID=578113 RepID=A0A194UNI2_CYTMA|nr:hypothetical protein VP1G_00588 [Valsa mali var. pyri (nom. inval.)]
MTLKQFNAEVRSARSRLQETPIPGIEAIEKGDSEGEVVVTLVHEKLPESLPIRLLAQNVDEYPDGNNFLLFIISDNVTGNITQTLEDLQNFTFGQKILEAVTTLSIGLQRALSNANSDGDTNMDSVHGSHLPADGSDIGILAGLEESSRTLLLSFSVRANKLGLSQEALEAWDVEASDYIVLLVLVDDMYPSADRVAQQPAVNFQVQFRFGKCTRYKPSLEQALAAFAIAPRKNAEKDASPPTDNDDQKFKKVFISTSLEQFMNESFISLAKLRLSGCATWDDANEKLRSFSSTIWDDQAEKKGEETSNTVSASNSQGKAMGAHNTSENDPADGYQKAPKTLPAILYLDSFAEPEPSVLLMAMQFAIHYFVRCTEYCLRCHRRIDKEFEALKPFVCSDPLCLFQYITMGFGPSIEHEIITQPYVVDLLICLCYSSVYKHPGGVQLAGDSKYPIRDFPSGLRLKVPSTVAGPATDEVPIKVNVDLNLRKATFSSATNIDNIPAGTWVVLRHNNLIPSGNMEQAGQPFYHHASIKYVDRQTSSFTIDLIRQDPSFVATGEVEMDVFVYSMEFDDLDNPGKARAMIDILNTVPPISHIREYLIKNPHSTLRSYDSISPAAATLLEWIVASNRSCILQVSPVLDRYAQDQELLATIKTREQEAIPSMKSCVQFRFAQGAPDKELRFHRALKDLKSKRRTNFPTLFAWHGSNFANWHSILRQGLDFNEVVNGRAYGNGVYFSQNFETSTGYAFRGATATWTNSALNGSGVISLCEIVNNPKEFVSTAPHLVVNQVDWIQCRYLFVQRVGGLSIPVASSADVSTGSTAATNIQVIPQDPSRPVIGPDNKVLEIPLKAIPSGRAAQQPKKQLSSPSSKRAHDITYSLGVSDEDDGADLEYLFSSDDENSEPPSKRLSSIYARDSSTDFRPGTLDLSTLPQLPVPEWANSNSTKRLASDIKLMQKVQSSTPPHELGWYVDFDKVDNMFQWIVELHSFEPSLPLAKDMKKAGVTSIVLEVRFGREYPFSPPFVRVIRPRFLPFASGGGGHVTIGGALCLELLTSTGWSPVTSMEAVFLSVKMAMSETEPAARLATTQASARTFDYGASEALDAYVRFANAHGWKVPNDLKETASQMANV